MKRLLPFGMGILLVVASLTGCASSEEQSAQVEVQSVSPGPLKVRVGLLVASNADTWMMHDLVYENVGKKTVRVRHEPFTKLVGENQFSVDTGECITAPTGAQQADVADKCVATSSALELRPGASAKVANMRLKKDLDGMAKLTDGQYVLTNTVTSIATTAPPEQATQTYELTYAVSTN